MRIDRQAITHMRHEKLRDMAFDLSLFKSISIIDTKGTNSFANSSFWKSVCLPNVQKGLGHFKKILIPCTVQLHVRYLASY